MDRDYKITTYLDRFFKNAYATEPKERQAEAP